MRSKPLKNTLSGQIKKREKAEEKLRISEAHFRLLVEGVKDYAIFFMDTSGTVLYWNKGARYLIGYKDAEIIGKNFARFFTKEDQSLKRPEKELVTAIEKGRADDENWIVRKDGSKFWASGVTTAVKDKKKNILYLAKIIHDLSSHKELEQRKDTFISMASHELKTPLTSMKLFIQILLRDIKDNQKATKLLKRMHGQVESLNLLVSDMLDLTRIQQGKFEVKKERFILKDSALEIIEDLQQVTSHKLVVDWQTKDYMYGNKERVKQVFTNFITNAIKYSPEEKEIIIKSIKKQGNIIVSIQDFGVGIPKKEQKHLFERYYQATNTHKTAPGLGLGLYIAKEIITGLSGRVWVESEVGKGSTFYFSLPIYNSK